RFLELLHHESKLRWRDRKIERRLSCGTKRLTDGLKRHGILVIAPNVVQQAGEFFERLRIHFSMRLYTVVHVGAELLHILYRSGDADNRYVQFAAFHHRLESREDLLEGEITRGSKENQRIRMSSAHRRLPPTQLIQATFSRCPPNS